MTKFLTGRNAGHLLHLHNYGLNNYLLYYKGYASRTFLHDKFLHGYVDLFYMIF